MPAFPPSSRPFSPSPPRENRHTASRPPSLLLGGIMPHKNGTVAMSGSDDVLGLPSTPDPHQSIHGALADGREGYFGGTDDRDEDEVGKTGPHAGPISMQRDHSADSSTSSSSPPLGATSLLAALSGQHPRSPSTPTSPYLHSPSSPSGYSTPPHASTSHLRGISNLSLSQPGVPSSPKSMYSIASSASSSTPALSSTHSFPRLHQPTVVRRTSGRGLSFLPPPAQVVNSDSGGFAIVQPSGTMAEARSSRMSLPGGGKKSQHFGSIREGRWRERSRSFDMQNGRGSGGKIGGGMIATPSLTALAQTLERGEGSASGVTSGGAGSLSGRRGSGMGAVGEGSQSLTMLAETLRADDAKREVGVGQERTQGGDSVAEEWAVPMADADVGTTEHIKVIEVAQGPALGSVEEAEAYGGGPQAGEEVETAGEADDAGETVLKQDDVDGKDDEDEDQVDLNEVVPDQKTFSSKADLLLLGAPIPSPLRLSSVEERDPEIRTKSRTSSRRSSPKSALLDLGTPPAEETEEPELHEVPESASPGSSVKHTETTTPSSPSDVKEPSSALESGVPRETVLEKVPSPALESTTTRDLYIPPYTPRVPKRLSRLGAPPTVAASTTPPTAEEDDQSSSLVLSATLNSHPHDLLPFSSARRVELDLRWLEEVGQEAWLRWVPGRRLIPADWEVRIVGPQEEEEAQRGLVRGVARGVVRRLPVVWRFAVWI